MKCRVTILIVDYMKAPRLVEGVRFLLAQETDFELKIVIVDNSCNKQNAKILQENLRDCPDVELIISKKNLGYAKGSNVIKGKEAGEYIFIANPDILFKEKDSLQKVIDYMDVHPEIAILGPKQINDTGETAMSVRAFPKFYLQIARRTFLRNFPIIRDWVAYDEMRHLDYSKIQDADWLQSSCFVMRRDFWQKVDGFDESYFLFMADTEMCFKAWELGYRVVYYPETCVYADGKRVSAGGLLTFFRSRVLQTHLIDSFKYAIRHFLKSDPRKKYYKKNNFSK